MASVTDKYLFSMINEDKFGEEESSYERPESNYKCGRSKLWNRSCWQGPDANGACGGATGCNPQRRGDRFYCTRPKRGGGACQEGPLPDGECAHKRPACVPVLITRRLRGLFSLITGVIVIAVIGLYANIGDGKYVGTLLIDPGDLSGIHSGYTLEEGCVSCHASHDDELASWLGAAFSTNDISQTCLNCHTFHEPQFGPHNFIFEGEHSKKTASCVACHKEHRGKEANLTFISRQTCGNCHQKPFTNFVAEHPEFPDKFPSSVPNSINFNHAKHLMVYFVDPKWVNKKNRDAKFAKLASRQCTTCHAIESAAGNEIKPKSFEQICKGCHLHQIQGRDLIILTSEAHTPITGLFLGMTESEAEDEEEEDDEETLTKHEEMLAALADDPEKVLVSYHEKIGGSKSYVQLFSGLNPVLIKQAAKSWINEEVFDIGGEMNIKHFGWLAGEDENDEQSLRYKSASHADPVMKVWMELLLELEKDESIAEEMDAEILTAVRDLVLDKGEGPGACGKCHGAGLTDQLESVREHKPEWGYRGHVKRSFTRYSHGPHINLLDPSKNCVKCHKLDQEADYASYFKKADRTANDFVSNFSSISKDICIECHRRGKVREDCTMCHNYHNEAGNKRVFQEVKKYPAET
jgi:hypothetical protein